MLRLWCLVYLQILIGDFQKGKIHVCSLKETKVIKGQSLQPPKKFATWSENRPKTVDSLANPVSSGDPGSILGMRIVQSISFGMSDNQGRGSTLSM